MVIVSPATRALAGVDGVVNVQVVVVDEIAVIAVGVVALIVNVVDEGTLATVPEMLNTVGLIPVMVMAYPTA